MPFKTTSARKILFFKVLFLSCFILSCKTDKKEDAYVAPTFRGIQDTLVETSTEYDLDNSSRIKEIKITKDLVHNSFYFEKLVDTISYVALETTPESLIGSLDKVLVFKDRFYILDRRKSKGIFVFDENGKFVQKIGRSGKGPGEYIELQDFAIDPKKELVYAYDRGKAHLISYDLSGNLISSTRQFFNFTNFAMIDSVFVLDVKGDYNAHSGSASANKILQVDQRGILRSKGLPFNSKKDQFSSVLNMKALYALNENTLIYNQFGLDTVYSITKNTISPRFVFQIDNPCDFETIKNQEHQDCIFFEGDLIENSIGQLFFSAVIDKSILGGFVSHKSDHPFLFNSQLLKQNELGYGKLMTAHQDLFVGYINAYKVAQFAENVKNNSDLNESLSSLLSQNEFENYGNPVLTLTRFREF